MHLLDKLKNKKIGIIGIGYMGSNIFAYLKAYEKQYNIRIVKITKENIETIIPKETFDYLINCAGTTGHNKTMVIDTIESNLCMNIFVLKHMNVNEAYLVISSTRIYGFSKNKKVLFSEDYSIYNNHLKLDFIFDGSKMLMESILINHSKNLKCRLIAVRLSNVYGNHNILDDSSFIKKIIRCKKENEKIITEQNRKDFKDYIYIDDAIQGILKALILSKKSDIFNIASGKSFSLTHIQKILNLDIEYKNKYTKPKYSNISIKKAKKQLDFKPIVVFDSGLKKAIYN